nr:zinc finger protein 239-like isoform X3 [Epinephelus lanceolatus]
MPSQQPDQLPTVEEKETYDSQQVREEQVDQCISPDMEADTPNVTEVRYPTSEPTINCELLPSSMDVTVSLNKSVDNSWNQREISPWPPQHHSVALFIGLEHPPRGERSCRFCGKHFTKDSYLIRHVDTSHNGHKAFKCLECNKEFEQRYYLVMHTRIHTGEKPFSCDYCDRTFSQNSSRLVHMRRHTGEKPYFCNKCGKSFAQSNHLRICKTRSECNITPEEMNISEDHKDRNAFKCSECNKEFKMRQQLVLHMRVHTGEKPYSCDFCGKSFTQSSNCIVHMRKHTGEKPYFCKKCGRSYTYSQHEKYCKGTQNESTNKSVRCTTCGKDLHTESNLKLHMEVHKSWRRHIIEKRQGQE